MGKRSGKFYRSNEREVMKQLGMEPTPNSGSGWIVKEDGQSEDLICQLKSTDASSIKIALQDIQKLEYNADVAHKLPVFAIQFLSSNQVFLVIAQERAEEVLEKLQTGKHINHRLFDLELSETPRSGQRTIRKIGSASKARQSFHDEQNAKYRKEKKAK